MCHKDPFSHLEPKSTLSPAPAPCLTSPPSHAGLDVDAAEVPRYGKGSEPRVVGSGPSSQPGRLWI